MCPRGQSGGVVGRVDDVGVGEQQVVRLERRGMADPFGDGPEFAGPAGGQRRGGNHGEEVGRSGGPGNGGGAVAAVVVHQDDMEIAGAALRGKRGDGAAHDAGFIAGGHDGHDARRGGGRRGRAIRAAGEFAPESAAEEQKVEPDGEGDGG